MIFLIPEIIVISFMGILLCCSSWTGQFSFEFSFFLSIGIFFLILISSIIRFQNQTLDIKTKCKWLLSYLTLLLFPLMIVLLFSFKYGLCSFSSGIQWFILLPLITLFYTLATVTWAASYRVSKWKQLLIALLPTLLISLVTLFDLYTDPAISFYHPVLGYFPGPFYDEWAPKFSALYSYRIWIFIFSIWILLQDHPMKKNRAVTFILLLPIFFRADLGWHYSHDKIQKKLSNSVSTSYTQIFYKNQPTQNIIQLGKSMDFYVKYISEKLQLQLLPDKKIRIYIYDNVSEKKKYTGTAETLIGNPMQRSLQLLPTSPSSTILVHELTHVIAAPLGMPLLKISPKIGLLEGLATAFQPSQMNFSIHEWSKAMLNLQQLPNFENVLGPFSFWKENPTKAYLATGSFSQWIIETYGIELFKQVYRGKSFEKTYKKNLPLLVTEWKTFLGKIQSSNESEDLMNYFLSQKSFHQKKCVHEVADLEMEFENCKNECTDFLTKACNLDPDNIDLNIRTIRQRLKNNIPTDPNTIPKLKENTPRIQANLLQLLQDDLIQMKNINNVDYSRHYQQPSFDIQNAISARIYLATTSPDTLKKIISGTYIPNPMETWPKGLFRNQAMFYFAKTSQKLKKPEKTIEYLKQIIADSEDSDFKLAYWLLLAQTNEELNLPNKAVQAYTKALTAGKTDGTKLFCDLQIKRLNDLMQQ